MAPKNREDSALEESMDGLWHRVENRVRDQLGQVGYETWIGPLNFVGLDGRMATIQAPNKFFRDWVNERYVDLLRQCLSDEAGISVDVSLVVERQNGQNGHHPAAPLKPAAVAPQAPPATKVAGREGRTQLNPRFTFAQFVVGSSNQFAHAAALAVAERPGEKYNPLFIYGGVGLGKTHLVTAIAHHLWNSSTTGRRVLFMPAEAFMNELISSIRRERMGEFKERFRRVDVLILDDVQLLAGRERTQQEFFHTFNALYEQRKQIILTSDQVPKDIPELEERLRNRFEWGLIADIQVPDVETRVAILERKAELESIPLPSGVALFLAQHVVSNVRELEGVLTRLGAHASLSGNPITVDYAREVIRTSVRPFRPQTSFDAIVAAVCERFALRPTDLRSRRRSKHV